MTSREAREQLKVTRSELSCLVRLGIVNPYRERCNYFLYSSNEVNSILKLKAINNGL